MELPNNLKHFVKNSNWVWAKTYEKFAPHWWCVRTSKNYEEFNKFVCFIRNNGVCRRWYSKIGMYLDYDGYSYWTMGGDLVTTNIINRKTINPDDRNMELPKEKYLNISKLPDIEELNDNVNPQKTLLKYETNI